MASQQAEIHLDPQVEIMFMNWAEPVKKKVLVGCYRKGATVIRRELYNALPPEYQKFKAVLKAKSMRGKNIGLWVGFYAKAIKYINKRSQVWDAYFLLLWQNYGTLDNRSKGHKFVYARRSRSKGMKGGIKPLGFFEKGSSDAVMQQAEEKAADAFEGEFDKFLRKKGFR
ncbi:hypothetical protein K4L44_05845 [Halosquirtibacter laminarini]|uniref:Uncharacterized protein n=1 Tax=Halosquirtibacter laminarini TaxID=3374600 RepID=A0AC61NR97_9BACT|nr:hypothetical protein K4L44_05845 [Prolixibacteraceae bacterium]